MSSIPGWYQDYAELQRSRASSKRCWNKARERIKQETLWQQLRAQTYGLYNDPYSQQTGQQLTNVSVAALQQQMYNQLLKQFPGPPHKPSIPKPTAAWRALYEQEREIALQTRGWVVGI